MEKKPSEKHPHAQPGDLGRWMMDINPTAVARIVEGTVRKFDPEKFARYIRVMERRQDGSDSR